MSGIECVVDDFTREKKQLLINEPVFFFQLKRMEY